MNLQDCLRAIASHSPFAHNVYRKLQDWQQHRILRLHAKKVNGPGHLTLLPGQSKYGGGRITPLGSVTTRVELMRLLENPALMRLQEIEHKLLSKASAEAFAVDGFCVPCNKIVPFLVDMRAGGQRLAGACIPNWRERLECPLCRMNNRQRLAATLVKQELWGRQGKRVYFMEQTTPIFNWAVATFKQHRLIGSEYFGHSYAAGTLVRGIRHEDIENLSFGNEQLDLIVSNDVFEHVPNPSKAFAECARVLKLSGVMLAMLPFSRDSDTSVCRARVIDGRLDHIQPPVFHGNPVSAEGSLVFTDFGWDLLAQIKNAGFSNVVVNVYASDTHGHLGGGQLVFKASK